jgi:mRNA-degrading endonuclease toxin of MazEF toxin-antitoxin module
MRADFKYRSRGIMPLSCADVRLCDRSRGLPPISPATWLLRHVLRAGMNTRGVVLCHQVRVLDLHARKARFSEKAPQSIIDEVLAKIVPLFE